MAFPEVPLTQKKQRIATPEAIKQYGYDKFLSEVGEEEHKNYWNNVPEYRALFGDQQAKYAPKKPDVETNQVKINSRGDFIPGVLRGIDQTQGMLYGAGAMVGSALGIDSLKDFGMRGYRSNMAEAAENPAKYSFKDVYTGKTGIGGALDWAQGTLGELAPTMATAALGSGVAALAGKTVFKKAAEKMVQQGIQKGLKDKAGKLLTEKAIRDNVAKTFMKSGMYATVGAMESGGMYSEVLDQYNVDAPFTALLFGAAAASLEGMGGNSRLIDVFIDGVARGEGKAVKEIAKRILKHSSEEALQEAGQEVMSVLHKVVNTDEKLLTKGNLEQIVEAAAAGAVGGGAGGIASNIFSGSSEKVETTTERNVSDAEKILLSPEEYGKSPEEILTEDEPVIVDNSNLDLTGTTDSKAAIEFTDAELDALIQGEETAPIEQEVSPEEPVQPVITPDSVQPQEPVQAPVQQPVPVEESFAPAQETPASVLPEQEPASLTLPELQTQQKQILDDLTQMNKSMSTKELGKDKKWNELNQQLGEVSNQIAEHPEFKAPVAEESAVESQKKESKPVDVKETPVDERQSKEPWQMTREEFSDAVYNRGYDFKRLGMDKKPVQPSVKAYHETIDKQVKEIAKSAIDKDIDQEYRAQISRAFRKGEIDKAQYQKMIKGKSSVDSGIKGSKDKAYLPDNTPIDFEYEVIEHDRLIPSHDDQLRPRQDFPQERQPRERGQQKYMGQIIDIASKLNPQRLGQDSSVSHGAPVIDKASNVVESGNGRTIAIGKAYNTNKGQEYKTWLQENSGKFGINPEDIRDMSKPVLVRRRTTAMDDKQLSDYIIKANQESVAKLSPSEQGVIDSKSLTPEDLSLFRPDESGNLGAASNRAFVNRFLQKMGVAETTGYFTENNEPNKDLLARVQHAVFQKAYQSDDLLKLVSEEPDADMQNVLKALNVAAGDFAKARALDESFAGINIVGKVVDAFKFIQKARTEHGDLKATKGPAGETLSTAIQNQVKQAISQQTFFEAETDSITKDITQIIVDNFRSGKRIGEFFKNLAEGVRSYLADIKQESFPGMDRPVVTSKYLVNRARKFLEDKYNDKQQDIFSIPGQQQRQGKAERNEPDIKGYTGEGNKENKPKGDTGRTEAEKTGEKVGLSEVPEKKAYGSGNKLFTADRAAKARELLKRKLSGTQLNAGIDPEVLMAGIELGGYHVEAGARTFIEFSAKMIEDIGENVRPYLKSFYNAVRDFPDFDNTGMNSYAEVEEILTQQETKGDNNVADINSNSNMERDRTNAGTQDRVGKEGIQDESGGDGRTGNSGVSQPEQSGDRLRGDKGIPGHKTPAAGKRGDLSPYSANKESATENSTAGSDNDSRGGDIGFNGSERTTFRNSEGKTDQAIPRSAQLRKKVEDQKKANITRQIKYGDRDDISRTLPLLQTKQQDDVYFAEKRFANPDGYGVMFTNGTGTGKTFSALGIIKRSEMQGKKNILVVVPDGLIIDSWMKASKLFDLDMTQLKDTNDSGSGIVITTYSNFGSNKTLAARQWDMVITDESHQLSMNQKGDATASLHALRAISLHPRGGFARHSMLDRNMIAEFERLSEQRKELQKEYVSDNTKEDYKAELYNSIRLLDRSISEQKNKLDAARKKVTDDVKNSQKEKRPRVVFLSATPFAYEKNVDYAEGYLFNYDEADGSRYNSGDGRERFMMTNFGYRMRYNKLTEPDANVNRGLMQRQFNTFLKKQGVLSGRMLDNEFDYDRKFVLVDSAVGSKIDEGLEFLWNNKKYSRLNDELRDKFDYLSRRYLLESIKAKEVIPVIKQHLQLGRKVVIFHDYIKGGGFNPFDFSYLKRSETLGNLAREFEAERPDLVNLPLQELKSPVATLREAFPDLLEVNGQTVSKIQAQENVNKFNDDATGPAVLIVQSDKDKGWSGHDTTGKHQRVLINLGLPTRPTRAIQQEGRIYRVGQASNAIFRYLNTGTNWERSAFADTIAKRASTAENLAMGEEARSLLDSFIQEFEDSDTYTPGHEGEGIGGKERDSSANAVLTEWDRAMSMYYAQQKKTSKNKAQEGKDYFATPEPLGLKMVEWANIKDGESVLEPSAGHGAIARWFPENTNRTMIEPSSGLASRAKMASDGKMVQTRFEDFNIINKFDAIVMNPPFGTAGKTAMEHIEKASKHLNDGGRIVALIPAGPSMDKRLDRFLYGTDKSGKHENPNIYKVASYNLPASVFERAGTRVSSRIIILDKYTDHEVAMKIDQQSTREYGDITSINDFFERIQESTVPDRLSLNKTEEKEQSTLTQSHDANTEKTEQSSQKDGESLIEHTTKKGNVLRGIVRKDISRDEAKAIDPYTFKKDGGFFIREKHLTKTDDARYSISSVKPWPENFPNVIVHTSANKVAPNKDGKGGHPDHAAAKAGDIHAAIKLVDDLINKKKILELKKQFPNAMVVPVHAVEASGKNKIPIMMADAYSSIGGFPVVTDIIQINKTGHTKKDALQRILSRAKFDGKVIKGQEYIILDDIVTTGETLSELRHYIENNGGKVVSASTLGFARHSTVLAIKPETLSELRSKFNETELKDTLREFDIAGELEALTQSEGKYILKFSNVDSFRNRILETGLARSPQDRFSVFQSEIWKEELKDNKPSAKPTKIIPGKEINLASLQAYFAAKKQTTGINSDGSLWVRLQNGLGFNVELVERFSPDEYRMAISSGAMDETGHIAGQITRNNIKFATDFATKQTIDHEIVHLMENSGILNRSDTMVLDGQIRKFNRLGKLTFSPVQDAMENRANFLAQVLATREQYRGTALGKVLQKIADFIDSLIYIGRQSTRKIARGIETGKIFSVTPDAKPQAIIIKGQSIWGVPGTKQHEIQAWHGSPHIIEGGFSDERLGSGEGIAAFGSGHYQTNAREIAEKYARMGNQRKAVKGEMMPVTLTSHPKLNSVRIRMDALIEDMQNGIKAEDLEAQKAELEDIFDNKWTQTPAPVVKEIEKLEEFYNRNLKESGSLEKSAGGNLYNTTIHKGKDPSQYDYMSWYEPLTESQMQKIMDKGVKGIAPETPVSVVYNKISKRLGSPKAATQFFLKAGIDGIEFPAGTLSQWKGKQAVNYVVFDPREITINERIQYSTTKPAGYQSDAFQNILPAEVAKQMEMNRGVRKKSMMDKISEIASTIMQERHHFPELMKDSATPSRSINQEILRRQQDVGQIAQDRAKREITNFIRGLDREGMDMYALNIILADEVRMINDGLREDGKLPNGFKTTQEVLETYKKLQEQTKKNPSVTRALKLRSKYQQDIAKDLVKYGIMPKQILQSQDYFHHQVLKYFNEKRQGIAAGSPEVRNKWRGWMKGRISNAEEYNTEYLEAEFMVLAQQIAQVETAKNLIELEKENNLMSDLKQQAKQANIKAVNDIYQKLADRGLASVDPLTGKAEDPLKPFKKKIAMGFSEIGQLIKHDKLTYDQEYEGVVRAIKNSQGIAMNHPRLFEFLSHQIERGQTGASAAAMIYKGIKERDKFIKTTLGDRFKTYKEMIPEGYKEWKPKPDNAWFWTNSIGDQVLQDVLDGTKSLEDKDVRKILARGKDVTWVIPEGLANQMDKLRPVTEHTMLEKTSAKVLGAWKQWILINPLSVVRYNLNNMSGDLDAVLAYNPAITKGMKKALTDLKGWASHDKISSDLKAELTEAQKLGAIGSGFAVQEVDDVMKMMNTDQIVREVMMGEKPGIAAKIWQKSKKWTSIREDVLRLAAYRWFKDQIENKGKTNLYGASNPKDIKNLLLKGKTAETAAKLARELLGDYGNISATGETIRRRMIPFYAWMEINLPRYVYMARNLKEESGSAKGLSFVVAKRAAVFAAKASMLAGAIMLWNMTMFPDEDDDMGESGRNQLHLILGRREDGSVVSVRFQGALTDALSWFGAEDLPSDIADLVKGKATIQDKLTDIPKAILNKGVSSLRPEPKLLYESITGQSAYPDALSPRPIRDKVENALKTFKMDIPYRYAIGRPGKGDNVARHLLHDLQNIVTYTTEPGVQAYYDTRKLVMDWKKENGLESGGGIPTKKGNALYYYKQAMKYGDLPAAKRCLKKYYDLGGTHKGAIQSIKMAHPIAGIRKQDRYRFRQSLSPAEVDHLQKGLEWYKRTYL